LQQQSTDEPTLIQGPSNLKHRNSPYSPNPSPSAIHTREDRRLSYSADPFSSLLATTSPYHGRGDRTDYREDFRSHNDRNYYQDLDPPAEDRIGLISGGFLRSWMRADFLVWRIWTDAQIIIGGRRVASKYCCLKAAFDMRAQFSIKISSLFTLAVGTPLFCNLILRLIGRLLCTEFGQETCISLGGISPMTHPEPLRVCLANAREAYFDIYQTTSHCHIKIDASHLPLRTTSQIYCLEKRVLMFVSDQTNCPFKTL